MLSCARSPSVLRSNPSHRRPRSLSLFAPAASYWTAAALALVCCGTVLGQTHGTLFGAHVGALMHTLCWNSCYIDQRTHARAHTRGALIGAYPRACTHPNTHTWKQKCHMHTRIPKHTHIHTCTWAYTHAHGHTRMHGHTHMHTRVHTCTRAHRSDSTKGLIMGPLLGQGSFGTVFSADL